MSTTHSPAPADSPCELSDDELTGALARFEDRISSFLRRYPRFPGLLVFCAVVMILSPLWVAGYGNELTAKDWSEVVKNCVESFAVLAGMFVLIKWVNERRDRSTEVLLKLDGMFCNPALEEGKDIIEDWDNPALDAEGRNAKLDKVLRFYVVLYGVKLARQVPDEALSVCFRFWLAHYFRKDRVDFRNYIDKLYPTLSLWLRKDCRQGCGFFRPERFFKKGIDSEFMKNCPLLPP